MKNLFIKLLIRQGVYSQFKALSWACLLLLCTSAFSGNAYAASIAGKTPVCLNDTANYRVDSPTGGLVYSWSTSIHGVGGASTIPVYNVQWITPGTGTVYAYGVDTLTGDTTETLNYSVTISLPHKPNLTTDYRVACQELVGKVLNQQKPPGILDTGKCMLVCSGATVTYYAHGNSGSTFSWAAAGHTAIYPMGDSCIVIWGSPKKGTLTCTETDSLGCSDDVTYCFEIIEKPLAHFETWAVFTDNDNSTHNSINICLNDLVIFKDISSASSTSPIMSCYWDFGDGKYTTTASPTSVSHKYTVPGTYTAMLVVKNACGCSDTARVDIEVKREEGQYITCPSVVCEGTIAGYKVHNYGSCPIFHWIVLGGTILSPMAYTDSIVVKWDNVDSTGFGYVMFDGSPCSAACNGSAIVKVPVIQNNGHITGPKTICVGQPAMYRLPQWPTTMVYWNSAMPGVKLDTTFQWNEIVVTADRPGTLILRANYHNTLLGCGGVAYDTITVIDTSRILEPPRYCVGTSVTWSLSVGGLLGDWVLIRPDGSTSTLSSSNTFSATLLTTGNYKLAVVGGFCGIDTLRFKVNPKAPPVDSLLGPDKACAGVPTTYEAKLLVAGMRNFHWAADAGSVTPGITATNAVSFSGPGPWEVKVWRSDMTTGCPSDTLRKTVNNAVAPATLSGDTVVCGSTRHSYEVDYKDGETYDWGVIATSDGTNYIGTVSKTKDSLKVEITWNNPHGTSELAKVWIRIRRCGTDISDTLDVLVQGTPVATISGPASICSGTDATFTFTATPTITSATAYSWSFGDGHYETTSTPTVHTYSTYPSTSSRTFPVTLIISGANGCASTVRAATTITVNPQPVLILGDVGGQPLNHCGNPTWTNTLGLLTGSTTPSTYSWTSGTTGTVYGTGSTLSVTPTLWGTGLYALEASAGGCISRDTIAISDSCGCDSTTRPTLTVSGNLSACAHISATGSWTPPGWGFDPSWAWRGSGIKSISTTATTFEADYDSAGVKKVIYKVKYLAGADTCETSDSVSVIVPYVPYLSAEFSCNGGGHKLTLTDVSSVFTGTYNYNFRLDGSTVLSTSTPNSSIDITTLVAGTSHTVELIITDGINPACTVSHNVTVPNMPVASFTIPKYNPVCVLAVVELTNTSPGSEPDWSAHWFFGDGSDNNLWSPWKEYGTLPLFPDTFYTVTLVITDRYGCSDTAIDTVRVVPDNLKGEIEILGSGCSGAPILLNYKPDPFTSTPVEYTWYEQTEILATTTTSPYTVYKSGGYWVFVKDAFGCVEKTPMKPASVSTPPAATISGPTEACEGDTYTLTCPEAEFYTGTAYYQWQVDGGTWGSFSTDPFYTTTPSAGTHTYRLATWLLGGCADTSAVHTVVVHPRPAAPDISVNVLNCDPYTIELGATSASAGVFNWSSGDAGTPIEVNTGGPYRVWITDANGCISYSDTLVPEDPAIYQYVFPTGCYTLCADEAPFTLMGPRPPASFQRWDWLFMGSSSLGGGPGTVPFYLVNTPGTYNLALDNGYCADTSGDMDVSFIDCHSGGCFGGLEFMGNFQTSAPPLCFDTVLFNITCGPGVTWSMHTDKGTLIPATGTGPAMGMKFRYIALPGFTPMEFVTIIFTDPMSGISCKVRIPMPMAPSPCDNSTARWTQEQQDDQVTANDFGQLLLRPNPASNKVQVDYSFNEKAAARAVEIYDITGRRVWLQEVHNASGTLNIMLDNYQSGLYQVILRQDGKVFLHGKLSVVK